MQPLTQLVRDPRQAAALGGAAAVVLGLAAYAIFRKRPTAEELEAKRRDHLAATGRITDGELIDAMPDISEPRTIIYKYRIAGVEYECSQDVSALQATGGAPLKLPALDLPVQVRYDRDNPGDSIVLADGWNGLWSVQPAADALPRNANQ